MSTENKERTSENDRNSLQALLVKDIQNRKARMLKMHTKALEDLDALQIDIAKIEGALAEIDESMNRVIKLVKHRETLKERDLLNRMKVKQIIAEGSEESKKSYLTELEKMKEKKKDRYKKGLCGFRYTVSKANHLREDNFPDIDEDDWCSRTCYSYKDEQGDLIKLEYCKDCAKLLNIEIPDNKK